MTRNTESDLQTNFFVDGHVDLPYFLLKSSHEQSFRDLKEGPFTFEKAMASDVRLFCTAIYCQDLFNGQESFKHYQQVFEFAQRSLESLKIIKNNQGLSELQNLPEELGTFFLLENADCLAGNISHIDGLRENGIFAVGLTHMGENRLGDGNAVRFSQGLTDSGREVARILSEKKLLIDIAHLHPACFRELLDLVETPMISSHTGIREAFDIQRNIDMKQVREIFQRGGMIGITMNPEMLAPRGEAEVRTVFVHMDMVVQKFGPDGVGIGSDLCGFEVSIKGMEDITGIGLLIEEMLNHGYGVSAVKKIMGSNWLGIYSRIFSMEGL